MKVADVAMRLVFVHESVAAFLLLCAFLGFIVGLVAGAVLS